MQYTISRFINGISLNPKEYAINEAGNLRLFSKEDALSTVGYDSIESAEEDWLFIKPFEGVQS